MIDIRQSSLYASFMQSIGWNVEVIDSVYFYIKKFPFLPAVIKLQRPDKIPNIAKLHKLMEKYHAKSISVEPSQSYQLSAISYQLINNPFLPTKTIYIDLTVSEEVIFNRFSEAKRRAVRRAEKNGVQVTISNNIEKFINLKNKTSGFLGFMTTRTFKPLWETFHPKNAKILLTSVPVILGRTQSEAWRTTPESVPVSDSGHARSSLARMTNKNEKYIAGILLLYFDNITYYSVAAATDEGKHLFAPTLLVWEALKLTKKNGCTIFDFEGVFDERFPKTNKEWSGFTKFKQGFGGKEIYFPKPFKVTL